MKIIQINNSLKMKMMKIIMNNTKIMIIIMIFMMKIMLCKILMKITKNKKTKMKIFLKQIINNIFLFNLIFF